jgi:hypothetical protein
MIKGLDVARRGKKEIRIRGDVKGGFFKLVKIIVHYLELYHSFAIIKV